MTSLVCELQYANGRLERCPEDEQCPFWVDDECALEPLYGHLERNRDLAAALLQVRGALTSARPAAALLPPGWS